MEGVGNTKATEIPAWTRAGTFLQHQLAGALAHSVGQRRGPMWASCEIMLRRMLRESKQHHVWGEACREMARRLLRDAGWDTCWAQPWIEAGLPYGVASCWAFESQVLREHHALFQRPYGEVVRWWSERNCLGLRGVAMRRRANARDFRTGRRVWAWLHGRAAVTDMLFRRAKEAAARLRNWTLVCMLDDVHLYWQQHAEVPYHVKRELRDSLVHEAMLRRQETTVIGHSNRRQH